VAAAVSEAVARATAAEERAAEAARRAAERERSAAERVEAAVAEAAGVKVDPALISNGRGGLGREDAFLCTCKRGKFFCLATPHCVHNARVSWYHLLT
jgi:hypothetical protein